MGRAPCCEKVGLNRGPWTREEDMRLIQYIQAQGEGCWRTLPKAAGLLRCGKSCRLRWINYLRPDLKRGNISEEEDKLIIKLHSLLGNRWSLIAGRLPGRTDNEIKNYWNTHLKKKLRNMGIDPQTHLQMPHNNPSSITTTKPFSKVISDLSSLKNMKHDHVMDNNGVLSNYNKRAHYVHHLDTSLVTSTIEPNININRPTNNLVNKSVLSFQKKPLDQSPSPKNDFKHNRDNEISQSRSHLDSFNLLYNPTNSQIGDGNPLSKTIFGSRHNPHKHIDPVAYPSSSSFQPSNNSYVAGHFVDSEPLIYSPLSSPLTYGFDHLAIATNNILNGRTLDSSSSWLSSFPFSYSSSLSSPSTPTTKSSSSLSSLSSSLHISKSSLESTTISSPIKKIYNKLEEIYPSKNVRSTQNLSSSHIHLSPLSIVSCQSTSSMLSTLSTSPSRSVDSLYGYHNNCIHEAIEPTTSCHDKKNKYGTMDVTQLGSLNKGSLQEIKEMMDEGDDLLDDGSTQRDKDFFNKHENKMSECSLRLIEGEVMWDMEIIHSIQEIGTPKSESSMLACSSYSLWDNDATQHVDDATPLFTWLDVGDDQ